VKVYAEYTCFQHLTSGRNLTANQPSGNRERGKPERLVFLFHCILGNFIISGKKLFFN